MTQQTASAVKRIGEGVDEWRERYGYPIKTFGEADHELNQFEQFVRDKKLEDKSIEKELGSNSKPSDSKFSDFEGIPIPHYVCIIPNFKKEEFTWQVLSYIYYHDGYPPSDMHIVKIIVPDCEGTIQESAKVVMESAGMLYMCYAIKRKKKNNINIK